MAVFKKFVSASARPQINGMGTKMFWWLPGLGANRARFPMLLTQITHNGITTASLDTTHLESTAPDDDFEFGGRTAIPATLSDPGQLTLEGFLNPSMVMPKGVMILQIIFPLTPGDTAPARWLASGFITQRGSINITTDTLIMQQNVVQLSGRVAITPAVYRSKNRRDPDDVRIK